MAEIVKKVQWADTLRKIKLGDKPKMFKKSQYKHLSNVRQTASRLKAAGEGYWRVRKSKCETFFTVIRKE